MDWGFELTLEPGESAMLRCWRRQAPDVLFKGEQGIRNDGDTAMIIYAFGFTPEGNCSMHWARV